MPQRLSDGRGPVDAGDFFIIFTIFIIFFETNSSKRHIPWEGRKNQTADPLNRPQMRVMEETLMLEKKGIKRGFAAVLAPVAIVGMLGMMSCTAADQAALQDALTLSGTITFDLALSQTCKFDIGRFDNSLCKFE